MRLQLFTWEEHEADVSLALKIIGSIKTQAITFPDVFNLETILLIDEDCNAYDVGRWGTRNRVSIDDSKYLQFKMPHVLVHNHPSGSSYPSEPDWRVVLTFREHKPCLFHMIAAPPQPMHVHPEWGFSMYHIRAGEKHLRSRF